MVARIDDSGAHRFGEPELLKYDDFTSRLSDNRHNLVQVVAIDKSLLLAVFTATSAPTTQATKTLDELLAGDYSTRTARIHHALEAAWPALSTRSVTHLYHGTSTERAEKIFRQGFKVHDSCLGHRGTRGHGREGAPCACQMMGPGVYLAEQDKAARYGAASADRKILRPRSRVLRCRVEPGECRVMSAFSRLPGEPDAGVDHCGVWAQRGFDSVFVPAGVAGLKRSEWCIRRQSRVKPDAWAEVTFRGAPSRAKDIAAQLIVGPWQTSI